MEKKNELFDVSLDSMMSTPIEVDAIQDNAYPAELMTASKEKKDDTTANKKAEEEINKELIDVDEDSTETIEEDEENEDILEETSSNTNSSQESKKQKTSSPLTPYAQLLVDEGVLPNLDIKKFDGTADGLKDAMIEEIVGAVDSYKESLPERIKHLINNYEEGIPLEKLLELDKIETDVAKVTEETLEEDVTLQKKLVADYLKRTTKFSDTKITKLVDGYEDSGELEDEAKASLTELKSLVTTEKEKEKRNVEVQRREAEEQRKRDLVNLQEKVKTTDEIIPGLKLNEKVKNNVFASMTTPVGYDQAGRPVNKIVAARMENPVEFEIKLHYLFEVTKGFTDFSKLSEKGKKDASKSFEQAVDNLDKSSFEDASTTTASKKKTNDFFKTLEKTFKI